MRYLYAGLVFCLAACNRKTAVETFIVSSYGRSPAPNSDSTIPPPAKAYYFPLNIIIDSSGQFFCYAKEINWNDDVASHPGLPKFIGLAPADIIRLPASNIDDFIKLNVLDKDTLKRYIAIISEKDTVQSEGLAKIIAWCKNPANHARWLFRLPTLEEAIVLRYKKHRQDYTRGAFKWDSTKIQMPR